MYAINQNCDHNIDPGQQGGEWAKG
jgi:hypothetical protein